MNNKDNSRARDIISIQIKNKIQYAKAYYANDETSTSVITDMDRFPYPRWYRGIANSDHPVIIEREAGYHMILKDVPVPKQKSEKPRHVFSSPCSTVLPLYAKEAPSETASQFCVDKFQ